MICTGYLIYDHGFGKAGGMELKRIRTNSVVQQIIDNLVEAMKNQELRPGDKIPTEVELAEKMGVGRNSVREAIKILVYLGVLEIRRAEGTYVCEGFSESMIDPLIYGIILNQADTHESLMELREIMEVGVLRLAMRHAEPAEKKELRAQLARMKVEIDLGEDNIEYIFAADNAFHDIITSMGHNPLLVKVDNVVRTLTKDMRYLTVSNLIKTGQGEKLYLAHEKICTMLENGEFDSMNDAVRGTYFEDAAGFGYTSHTDRQ